MIRAALKIGGLVLGILLGARYLPAASAADALQKGPRRLGRCMLPGSDWIHLSSRNGDLPKPADGAQQTGCIVGDLAKDGVNGFVLSFRKQAPALVWFRHGPKGWDRYVIDKDLLQVEAGGAIYDIDGDGYPDIVFGADYQGGQVWWWRNPGGKYDPNVPWERHIIKGGGAHQHHDQIFGDFKGTGKPQLVFWNQGSKKVMIADIPADPRNAKEWPQAVVFDGNAQTQGGAYAEGVAAADIDGDGRLDILAGNFWFKHVEGNTFKAIRFADFGGRVAVGQLKPGPHPQIVVNSGDGVGPLKWYECNGNTEDPAAWVGHELVHNVVHGHSLAIADINGDGHLDIFAAEMAQWSEYKKESDNPNNKAWIFFGDGKGNFEKTEFVTGMGWHEARVADLYGDGMMDILSKPYNWDAPRVDIWRQVKKQGPGAAVAPAAHTPVEIGLELYSLRDEMSKSVPATLAHVKQFGFTDVEVASFNGQNAEEYRKLLDANGLKAASVVMQYDLFRNGTEAIIKDAKTLGAHYVIIPWIPHQKQFTADNAREAAGHFNKWGEELKQAGLQLGFHPHGYEFSPEGDGTVFDVLATETKPDRFIFELDVFWAYHAGQDPVKFMEKYGSRWELIHLKDMKKGTKTGVFTGQAPVETSVAVGSGMLDFPAIMKEAKKIGVKHYYIEDEAPNAAEQLPETLKFLEPLR